MFLELLFLPLFLSSLVGSICSDVDEAICAAMLTQKPDMCTESCYLNLCPRTCGTCPPLCYSCHEISDPRLCNTTIECPSKGYWCAVTETLTDQFNKVFKLGCSTTQHCTDFFETNIPMIGRRKRGGGILQGECCPDDRCNNDFPNSLNVSISSNTVSGIGTTVASVPDCTDIETTICSALANTLLPVNLCDNPCIAKTVCPKTCGNCLECYDCSRVQSTQDCVKIKKCNFGEKCYTLQTNVGGEQGFRVGCMTEDICSRFTTLSGSGRRSLGDVRASLSGGCCLFDRCNNKPLHARARLRSFSAPVVMEQGMCPHNFTSCPDGSKQFGKKCYFVSASKQDWINSQQYCNTHCANLAIFENSKQMMEITEYLESSKNFYIGAYVNSDSKFVWTESMTEVTVPSFPSNHLTPNTCGHITSSSIFNWDLLRENCYITRHSLCQINLL